MRTTIRTELELPAEVAWSKVADQFGDTGEWTSRLTSSYLDGEEMGVGATRVYRGARGVQALGRDRRTAPPKASPLGQARQVAHARRASRSGLTMLVEATFGSEEGRRRVLNWEEIAWAYVDRMSAVALRTADARIDQLVTTVRRYLAQSDRPPATADPHVVVKFAVDGLTLSTFTTFLRFENARDVTLSELAVELVFPADEPTRQYFTNTT